MTAGGNEVPEPRLLGVLSAPQALEERVVDWLLAHEEIDRFSSSAVELHGEDPEMLRGAEKVRGRQRRTQFQVEISALRVDALTGELAREFEGADLRWFFVPITAAGHLR